MEKRYEVWGMIRRSSSFNTGRIDHLYRDPHDPESKFHLVYGDLTDASGLSALLQKVRPDEVYNLGAQSHVRISFDQPVYTVESIALGTLNLLEACRQLPEPPRFYQASSSEMYGNAAECPQRETTPFYPRSPYACAKVYAFHQVVNYREAYDMFACNGILFNHESPRRGETFVSRKITRIATRIKLGVQDKLYLGNLKARRDWGFAGDYVQAMWLMLQQEHPGDYVVATGETHSVQEFVLAAFGRLDLDWNKYVKVDFRYFRPTEVEALCGNADKARMILGWKPTVRFHELVEMMVDADMKLAEQELALKEAGLV